MRLRAERMARRKSPYAASPAATSYQAASRMRAYWKRSIAPTQLRLAARPTWAGPAAQFKAFADASSDRWSRQQWANKIAAGFTTGACAGGDQLHTLTYFSILAAQHGMLWCGLDIPGGEDPSGRNRLGSQLGLATHLVDSSLPQSDLTTAEYLGQRLAKMASRNG
ncbi:multimeric flavodoxin WrbA [Bradyrhizobium sp. F1.13.4]